MILPVIVGQAPSRLGDGRPFTGPSGDRLVQWAGVDTREELLRYFRLDNLMAQPLPNNPHERKPNGSLKTINFSRHMGRVYADLFVARQRDYMSAHSGHMVIELMDIVVLGKRVWESLDLRGDMPMFGFSLSHMFKFHRFPHPSGLNHQMNDPEFVRETSHRLRQVGRIITTDEGAGTS